LTPTHPHWQWSRRRVLWRRSSVPTQTDTTARVPDRILPSANRPAPEFLRRMPRVPASRP